MTCLLCRREGAHRCQSPALRQRIALCDSCLRRWREMYRFPIERAA